MKRLVNINRSFKLGIALALLLGAQPVLAGNFTIQDAFSLCQNVSTVKNSERANYLAAQGFSPASKLQVVEVVDQFQRLNVDPSTRSIASSDTKFRELVDRRVSGHLAPTGFAATRFKPQKSYVNAQGDMFLVGGISDRTYLSTVRKGLVRCDLYSQTWTPRIQANKLVKTVTSRAGRKMGSSGNFYQIRGSSEDSPALVIVEITAFNRSADIPAITRLFIELTADYSS